MLIVKVIETQFSCFCEHVENLVLIRVCIFMLLKPKSKRRVFVRSSRYLYLSTLLISIDS